LSLAIAIIEKYQIINFHREASGFINGVKETWIKIIKQQLINQNQNSEIKEEDENKIEEKAKLEFNNWMTEKKFVLDYWNS
jgi:hypothetical protein